MSLDTPRTRTPPGDRPESELRVDLHVYIVPSDLWQEHLHSAVNQVISDTVSVGFIRVLPETTISSLREEIESQFDYESIPKNYVFLRCVGRCFTRLRPKQERTLKVKHFIPPQTYAPELFILESSGDDVSGVPSTATSSATSVQKYTSRSVYTSEGRFPVRNRVPPIADQSNDNSRATQTGNEGWSSVNGFNGGGGASSDYDDAGVSPDPTSTSYDRRGAPGSRQHRIRAMVPLDRSTQWPSSAGPADVDDEGLPNSKASQTDFDDDEDAELPGLIEVPEDEEPSDDSNYPPLSATPTGMMMTSRTPMTTKTGGKEELDDRERRELQELLRKQKEEEQRLEAEKKRLADEQKAWELEQTSKREADERQRREAEKRRQTDEQRRLAEQRAREDEERAEATRRRMAEEQRKIELEWEQLEENRRKLEEQRKSDAAERERRAEEEERSKLDEERRRLDDERAKLEEQRKKDEERRRLAEEQARLDAQRKLDDERKRLADEKQRLEDQRKKEEERNRLRAEQQLAKQNEAEKAMLLKQIAEFRDQRLQNEQKRDELIGRARQLQNKARGNRSTGRDVWKKKYFEEKRKTVPLDDQSRRLRTELDGLHKRILTQLDNDGRKNVGSVSSSYSAGGGQPSQKTNLKMQAVKYQQEIDSVQRRIADINMKLTAEMKLRNQVEQEVRALKAELTQKRSQTHRGAAPNSVRATNTGAPVHWLASKQQQQQQQVVSQQSS